MEKRKFFEKIVLKRARARAFRDRKDIGTYAIEAVKLD